MSSCQDDSFLLPSFLPIAFGYWILPLFSIIINPGLLPVNLLPLYLASGCNNLQNFKCVHCQVLKPFFVFNFDLNILILALFPLATLYRSSLEGDRQLRSIMIRFSSAQLVSSPSARSTVPFSHDLLINIRWLKQQLARPYLVWLLSVLRCIL